MDLVLPEMMVSPTRNINLHEGGRSKRGGSSHVGDALSGTPQIMGLAQFRLTNGTEFIVRASADGKIWKNTTTTLKTGLVNNEHVTVTIFGNEAYFCKKSDKPQIWDGVAGSTIDHPAMPTDWASGSYPKQMIAHGRGASERLWACGCPNTPYTVYASKLFDGRNFSDAEVICIPIDTGDGFGIVALGKHGDRLLGFGKNKPYIIDDISYDKSEWGYVDASWEGGVAHHRLLVPIENDLLAMAEDGVIYSISAVAAYGDYRRASITEPAFIDRWLRDNADMSKIDKFHGVYDPTLRAVKWFVVRSGMTEVDTALIYFVDRPANEAWMIHDNQAYVSGYSASASARVRAAAGKYKIYTGDYDGQTWELENPNKNDNGNPYFAGFRTPYVPMENPRTTKSFDQLELVTKPEGNYDIDFDWFIDGVQQTSHSIPLGTAGGVLGAFVLGVDHLAMENILSCIADLGNTGKRVQVDVHNNRLDEDFFISELLFDLKDLGAQ